MTPEINYSDYTIQQLLMARLWSDTDGQLDRKKRLEDEIRKRYAHFQDAASGQETSSGSATRFRPWGSMAGITTLGISIVPRLVDQFLAAIGFVEWDYLFIWNVWALVTLPIAATVFLIGGVRDAERVAKWFHR